MLRAEPVPMGLVLLTDRIWPHEGEERFTVGLPSSGRLNMTNLVDPSPVALEILDEIRSDHRPQPAPRCDAGPDWALLFLLIAVIGEIVGVIKILFD